MLDTAPRGRRREALRSHPVGAAFNIKYIYVRVYIPRYSIMCAPSEEFHGLPVLAHRGQRGITRRRCDDSYILKFIDDF